MESNTQLRELPKGYETKPNDEGIFERIIYERRGNEIYKITKRIKRTTKTYKLTEKERRENRIKKRKKIKPFIPKEGNEGVTLMGAETFIERPDGTRLGCNPNSIIKLKKDIDYSKKYVAKKGTSGTSTGRSLEDLQKEFKKTQDSNKFVPVHLRPENKDKYKTTNDNGEVIISSKLIIFNLDTSLDENDIAYHFQNIAEVKNVYIMRDKNNGSHRGFGFVTFYNETDATNALEICNNKPIGRAIADIKFAKDRNKKPFE